MGFFSGLHGKRTPEAAAVAGHHSLALKALLDSLDLERRSAVLDLGPPLGRNLEFLAARACRVQIADLYRALSEEPFERKQPDAFGALLERLLPLARGERLDLIFAWDLFDYLRPDQIATLMAWLASAASARTLVLALVSTRPRIPRAPLRYRIVDESNLAWEGPLDAARPSPRLSEPDFARLMPAFKVRASFLLRSGLQEYVLAGRRAVRAPE